MENFLKATKIKLVLACLATLLPVIIVSSLEAILKEQFNYELLVLRYLVFGILEAAIIFKIAIYSLIIGSEKWRIKLYTKYNDERNAFIKTKSYNLVIKTILFLNALFMIVAGYYKQPHFFFLLSIECILILLIYGICYLYYRKKY